MISFKRVDVNGMDGDRLTAVGDVNVFQTPAWLNFLASRHGAEPVLIEICQEGDVCGYFSGLIVRKYGLKILGSPFRGWATYFMGFNLKADVSRFEVLEAFRSFVFNKLRCHYVEIIDPWISMDMRSSLHYHQEHLPWFALDLSQDEDEMFANMKDTGRRGVRKALKSGVQIEECSDIGFAEEYFSQYRDVMVKQSLAPVYELEEVRRLIEAIYPTGSLILLRARDPDGLCIATAIFLVLNKTAIYWGGASLPEHQHLHPNELIIWHAMKEASKRGAKVLHLGGEAEQFKLKFGSTDAGMFRLRKASNVFLDLGLQAFSTVSENERFRNWFIRKI